MPGNGGQCRAALRPERRWSQALPVDSGPWRTSWPLITRSRRFKSWPQHTGPNTLHAPPKEGPNQQVGLPYLGDLQPVYLAEFTVLGLSTEIPVEADSPIDDVYGLMAEVLAITDNICPSPLAQHGPEG